MPNVMLSDRTKKKFEQIRGKFLATGLFMNLSRADTIELMIDVLNRLEDSVENHTLDMIISVNEKGSYNLNPFEFNLINDVLEKRKEKK